MLPKTDPRQRTALRCSILSLPVIFSLILRFRNLHTPILDQHGFRQAQTAITIREFLRSGFDPVNYITPIFGATSRIPFEFPVYQSVCYFVLRLLGKTSIHAIDVIGRLVSIGFFLLSVIVLYLLVKELFRDKWVPVTAVFLYCTMPSGVFWSRTVMVETCTVFFLLAYGYFFIRYLRKRNAVCFIAAMLCGTLGYLSKATSAIAIVIVLAYEILYILIVEQGFFSSLHLHKTSDGGRGYTSYLRKESLRLLSIFLLCVIPVLICLLWNRHADALKTASGISELTSERLSTWNFSTLSQRFSIDTWEIATQHLFEGVPALLRVLLVLFAGFALLLALKEAPKSEGLDIRTAALFGLAAFMTVFICINLYAVHNYYQCAILPYISVCLSALFAPIFSNCINGRTPVLRFLSWLTVLTMTMCMIMSPLCKDYLLSNHSNPSQADYSTSWDPKKLKISNAVADLTGEDDWILFHGFDWSSEYLYYADRRGIMYLPWVYPEEERETLIQELKESGNLACVVMTEQAEADDSEPFAEELHREFELGSPTLVIDNVLIYRLVNNEEEK